MPVFPACQGNAECCLTHTLPDELMATLTKETLKCNPDHLGRLMADHAQLDWRPVLPRITKPCLNLYGTTSGCFPVEGTAAVGELIPDCKNVPFEGCNHCEFAHGPLLHTDEPLIRRTQLRRSTHPHLAPHKNLMSPTWLRTAGLYLEKPDIQHELKRWLGCGMGATHELLEPGLHDIFDELSAAVAARSSNDRDFEELRRAVAGGKAETAAPQRGLPAW